MTVTRVQVLRERERRMVSALHALDNAIELVEETASSASVSTSHFDRMMRLGTIRNEIFNEIIAVRCELESE